MSLNPFRSALARAGLDASRQETPFKAEADAALDGFHAAKRRLEQQVLRGEITTKVARQAASDAARQMRTQLASRADGYSPVPRAFLERLIDATQARKAARDRGTLESLQRETNALLRQSLVEQQIVNRSVEFEGRAFLRASVGAVPAPTLDSLLGFHETAAQSGDEAAMEWARRHLEGMRHRAPADEDQARIDQACDRPDRLNPRIIARYVEVVRAEGLDAKERFAAEARASRDANACAAAYLMAREDPESVSARWVRAVLDGIREFPEAALNALRSWEAEARKSESDAAVARAEFASAVAEADARLTGLEAPTAAEVDRLDRIRSLPVAEGGEPIGLALDRRGTFPSDVTEFEAMA